MIKQSARESGQAIKFQSKVATKDNFVDVINQEPRILHIACHGYQDKTL